MEDIIKVNFLGRPVRLLKKGQNYAGDCPVCGNYGLVVGVERKIFHCFSCGTGGYFVYGEIRFGHSHSDEYWKERVSKMTLKELKEDTRRIYNILFPQQEEA